MFNLITENGVVVQTPQTLGQNHVLDYLNNRSKGGFMHVVAYTNAKPTTKAKDLGLNLVKISECYCILGKPKKANKGNVESTTPKRVIPQYYTTIDKNLIQYFKDNSIAIQTHLNNNRKHKGKSYYFDTNTNVVYTKDYLLENKLIQKSTSNDNDIKYVQFKVDNIIYIK